MKHNKLPTQDTGTGTWLSQPGPRAPRSEGDSYAVPRALSGGVAGANRHHRRPLHHTRVWSFNVSSALPLSTASLSDLSIKTFASPWAVSFWRILFFHITIQKVLLFFIYCVQLYTHWYLGFFVDSMLEFSRIAASMPIFLSIYVCMYVCINLSRPSVSSSFSLSIYLFSYPSI